MSYQKKPLFRPLGQEQQDARSLFHQVLLAATETGAKTIGCTGASFVTSSMGIWMQELAELDGRSTAKFLSALSVLADPKSNHNQKVVAEKKRRSAVEQLLEAVDLDMQTTGEPKH